MQPSRLQSDRKRLGGGGVVCVMLVFLASTLDFKVLPIPSLPTED